MNTKKKIVMVAFMVLTISILNISCSEKSDDEIVIQTPQPSIQPSKLPAEEPDKEYVISGIPQAEINKRPKKLQGEIILTEYDLGESVITQEFAPMDMPYRMQGAIAVPPGNDRFPVVFVMHGAHPVFSEEDITSKRYDLGFKYLLEELASYGYVAVSLNVNAQYALVYGEPYRYERLIAIFNDHLDNLYAANNSSANSFGITLKDRMDLSNITLIGHSRSGQGLHYIYENMQQKGNDIINALLMITPSEIVMPEIPYADINVGIIISELDGDVKSLHGQQVFDKYRTGRIEDTIIYDKTDSYNLKEYPISLLYLYGANHNAFNLSLETDDSQSLRDRESSIRKITKEEQQDFLKQYVVDFLSSINKNNITGIGINSSETMPGSLYGLEVSTSYDVANKKVIWMPKDDEHIENNLLGGNNITENSKIQINYDTSFYKTDSGPFSHPTRDIDIGMINITWDKKGASVTTTLPQNHSDLMDYKALSLYMAVDPTSEQNEKGTNQAMSVLITDKSGNKSKVHIDNTAAAMRYNNGYIVENQYADYYSTFTPLSTLLIPLEYFKKVDISNIESITLLFDKTESGSIMVGEFSLFK